MVGRPDGTSQGGRRHRGSEARPRRDPRPREPLRNEHPQQPGRPLHQLPGDVRGEHDPVVRRDAPEPAELHRAVLRLDERRHRRQLPAHLHDRQPRRPGARRRDRVHRLLRRPAERRLHRLHEREVRTQAQPMGQLLQRPGRLEPAADELPDRLLDPARHLVRDPEPRPRHARRHDRAGRHLDPRQPRRLRPVGEDAQQPAGVDVRRGRQHRRQPDPDRHRRPAGPAGSVLRAHQPLQRPAHDPGRLRTAAARQQRHGRADPRHLDPGRQRTNCRVHGQLRRSDLFCGRLRVDRDDWLPHRLGLDVG